jgi:serine/threonine protein kinase/tetratricopeptide (TPR) repeat protein
MEVTKQGEAETIFHAALELAPEQRAAFLTSACGNNTQLRNRVTALLRAVEAPMGFLPEQPGSGPDGLGSHALPKSLITTEQPGDQIGRYKLLQKLGEGGCGVVYMAEQEHPVRRRVALKIIKLGMDTREVVARFEAERQALALMDHANIARVLDAGATETGRPYFVMELVRGIKITEYADQNSLSTQERVELSIQVCRAIQHAHQKGIIHRDIKPSNVLVTLHDGVPVPKVIDFGIAKAAQGRLTDHTLFTAFDQFIGTPAYMSPEQAEMSGLDIDTRSDIYSLGVLLYEILTGKPPFDTKELMAGGLGEVRDRIRQKEPTRPSTMLSTMMVGDLAKAAKVRQTEPFKLISLIRGDLEWIVMKCLEKDRTRRYETANGLAADLERHLNNEPVTARPPSSAYLFLKFVRRHKFLFASASAVAAALFVGLALSTWLLVRETKARRRAVTAELAEEKAHQEAETSWRRAENNEARARTEANKSTQVAKFLKEMLQGIDPSIALGRDTVVLQQILDRTAGRVDADLESQPEVAGELLSTIGTVYLALGRNEQAERMLRRALAFRIRSSGDEDPTVAQSYHELAPALLAQGKKVEAEDLEKKALAMRIRLLGESDREVASSLSTLGNIYLSQQKQGEAGDCFNRALRIRKQLWGDEHLEVAQSMADIARVLSTEGKWEEAERNYRQALAIDRKLLGDQNPTVAYALQNLTEVLLSREKFEAAETIAREALAMRRQVLGTDHPLVADSRTTLATALNYEGNLAEAEAQVRLALAVQSKLKDAGPGFSRSINLFVEILLPQGRVAELDSLFDSVMADSDLSQPLGVAVLQSRASFEARTGRWHKAAANYAKLLAANPSDHEIYHSLAPLLVRNGDQPGYLALRAQIRLRFGTITNDASIADRMAKDLLILPASGSDLTVAATLADVAIAHGKGYRGEPWFQLCKGLAEFREGKFDEASVWTRRALLKVGQTPTRDVEAYMILAMALQRLNNPQEARVAWDKGLTTIKNNPDDFNTTNLWQHGWIDMLIALSFVSEARTQLGIADLQDTTALLKP